VAGGDDVIHSDHIVQRVVKVSAVLRSGAAAGKRTGVKPATMGIDIMRGSNS